MARIRTIKPDAFTSDSLSRVPRGVRWTFAGLWTYLDDRGRGRDDVRLIKAALYPLDDEVSLSVLTADLDLLVEVGCICRYEVDGKFYLHVQQWWHQKISHPTESKLPTCSRHILEDSGIIPESFVKPPDPLRPERKGKEGKGKEGTRASTRAKLPTPDDWTGPTDKHKTQATALELDVGYEAERFLDSWRARGARYKDPEAAFRNWLRQSAKWGNSSTSPNAIPDSSNRRHVPLEVPSHIDPDDTETYAAWLRAESK